MSLFWVFLGGGLGALARYGVARLLPFPDLTRGDFPWATFSANLLACLVLALGLTLVARGSLSRSGQLLLLTGFCGGFSTFSTFAAELLELVQSGHGAMGLLYLLSSILSGVAVLWLVLYLQLDAGG